MLRLIRFKMKRCFSAMNVVKKKLRYKMGDRFMSDSLIYYIEKDIFSTISKDAVFNLFKVGKIERGHSKSE